MPRTFLGMLLSRLGIRKAIPENSVVNTLFFESVPTNIGARQYQARKSNIVLSVCIIFETVARFLG